MTNFGFTNYDRQSATADYNNPYSTMSFAEMLDLYKCLPNLEDTNMYIYNYGSLANQIDYLHRVFSNCPKLKSFDCYLRYSSRSSISIDEILKRYPLFEHCSACTWSTGRVYECRITCG